MKLKLICSNSYCVTIAFEINGIKANSEDFGEQYDSAEVEGGDGCCGDMQFNLKPITQKVLDKYYITPEEYKIISEKLKTGLSFGECDYCE